jgi:hypothetical protein
MSNAFGTIRFAIESYVTGLQAFVSRRGAGCAEVLN